MTEQQANKRASETIKTATIGKVQYSREAMSVAELQADNNLPRLDSTLDTDSPEQEAIIAKSQQTAAPTNIKMPAYTYSVNLPQEAIVNALESGNDGIRYWGYVAKFKDGQSWEAMLNGKCELTIVEDESHKDETANVRHTLNSKGIRKALNLIASKWPHHMKSLITDDSDAETGDVLIQVAIFSDIIYG